MKVYFNQSNLPTTVKQVTWQGDFEQASRIVDVTLYVDDISDYIKPGITLKLTEEDVIIFEGKVYRSDFDENSRMLKLKAYDPLFGLTKSSINKKFKQMTALEVTEEIAKAFEIKCHSLAPCEHRQTIYAMGSNAYQVIKDAYDEEAKRTQTKINIIYDNGITTIKSCDHVVESIFDAEAFVLNANAEESIENVIIEATLITEAGEVIEHAVNTTAQSAYGLSLPRVVSVSNGDMKASVLLVNAERNHHIECIGDIRCISGKTIRIFDKRSGKIGRFLIESDTHQFSSTQHTMQLDVNLLSIEGD